MTEEAKEKRTLTPKTKKLIIIVACIFVIAAIVTTAIIIALSRRENVGDILALGDRYMSEMDYEAAIREYRHAIEIDPKSEDAYIKLAEAYIAMGDIDSAIDVLEEGYEATRSERILERLNELRGEGQTSPVAERVVMASTPQKTTYYVGETLDLTGLTLTVTYSDGTTEEISDGYTCDVKTLDEAGTVEVTVRYGEAETTVTVTVVDVPDTGTDNTEPPVTETIETEPSTNEPSVTEPTETVPLTTEPLTTEPSVTEAPETEPPTMEAPVTVSPTATLTGISIKTQPAKTTYYVGDTLDMSGLTLTATYSDGKTETVRRGFTCSPTTLNTAGTQTITVTYGGKTATFSVSVTGIKKVSGTYGKLSWVLESDGTLTISGQGAMDEFNGENEKTSWREYDGYIKTVKIENGVTSIAGGAFDGCVNLTSVTIPNSVTSIGAWAFDATALMSITIPSSVTEMGEGAFYRCKKLETVKIESTVIGFRAFGECEKLKSVVIPKCLKNWDNGFAECTGLESVQIENGVTSIAGGAFDGCVNLTSVTIPNSVTSIGAWAFDATALTSITIPSSVTEMGEGAFYRCKKLETVKIESTVIGFRAFGECEKLKSVVIPKCLKNWDNGFAECTGLESVQIENGVTSIAGGAFDGCVNLTSVTIPNSVTSIGAWAFDATALTSITIPSSVTEMGEGAFYRCKKLETVKIESTVIGFRAFGECEKLKSVVIPKCLKNWDNGFAECTGLESVQIENGVTSIAGGAFNGCVNLTSVTIPNSVTSIGDSAFWGCSNFTIHGHAGSYAEQYAKENEIKFVAE